MSNTAWQRELDGTDRGEKTAAPDFSAEFWRTQRIEMKWKMQFSVSSKTLR
jgi:hypothetical protein